MSFTYNDEGIRTSKTVNGVTHTYYLNGSQITAEEWEDKLIVYLYDAYGSPIGMMFRKTSYIEEQWDTYWFEKNLQGDIMSVYDSAGNKVAYYSYKDAWGNHSETYINLATNEGVHYNPFRYRGYYYDIDLDMYYLQSRYYDAKICRFINADSALYSTMLGYNLFAYCGNNPVTRIDPTGEFFYDDNINLEDDFYLEGAGAGGFGASGNYFGYGTSYYNYSVYSRTAAYDAGLGGYYYGGGSSIGGYTSQFLIGNVSVPDSMAGKYNYTSHGSTGRIQPKNLKEKLAMEQVKASPLDGAIQIPVPMTDSRWPATEGWVKMAANINGIEIHFVYNKIIQIFDDFKFK